MARSANSNASASIIPQASTVWYAPQGKDIHLYFISTAAMHLDIFAPASTRHGRHDHGVDTGQKSSAR